MDETSEKLEIKDTVIEKHLLINKNKNENIDKTNEKLKDTFLSKQFWINI